MNDQDKNINRRKFLKQLAQNAVFIPPTITSFDLLQTKSPWWWWTGHHHHHTNNRPTPPPPPPGYGNDE
ncbi:MAG: hypothetical protein JXQ65_03650 [Candidatus Marinimicrobia bacterium]|nr:hypothetical protein [Candidatus Neomarinimicrobiota bacterium]